MTQSVNNAKEEPTQSKKKERPWLKAAVNICRLLLATTFIFSGFVKANDPFGTVYKMEDYIASMAWFTLPETFLLGCAVLLALFEFLLGVYLLFGISRKKTPYIAAAFMTAMTMLTIYIFMAEPVSDCGCFGDVVVMSNGASLAKNIVLLAAAIFVCRHYKKQINFIGPSIKWFVSLLSLCFIVGYAIRCIICLPALDFRPYKVGTNLRESIMSAQPSFEVKIVYEKDGQTLELTAEDDDPDSTWNYLETRRIPVGQKNTAATDFYVADSEDNDVTTDIVTEDMAVLLIVPDLRRADEGCIDKVNEVFDYTAEQGIPFYCLTASTDNKDKQYWRDHTGAEYDYYQSEDRLLKTIVRGKPGLVLLKNGVVSHKWSNYNMPDEKEFKDYIQ